MIDPALIADELGRLYPDAHCTLDFQNPFQCLVAVSLSAQTTDKKVNEVTPALFRAYPDPASLGKATPEEVGQYIRSLGLWKNKAKNLVSLGQELSTRFQGQVPSTVEELTSLPGVGIKTASVVLAECFQVPSFPVDTHVGRVAKRLYLTSLNDEPEEVMKKLKKKFPRDTWIALHHRFIAFGRDICHAQNPECDRCPFTSFCRLRKPR